MSIFKGIMRRWNKLTKQYDEIHLQTEVAMIVDWDDKTSGFQQSTNLGNDILKNLASTAAITAVTALTTDSWFGKLLKFVLDASGVKYSLEQNGYICFGSFFGGLIIQWGSNMALPDGDMVRYMYPLSMSLVFCGVANAINSRADYLIRFVEKDNISFGLDTSSEDNTMAKWFVLGVNN